MSKSGIAASFVKFKQLKENITSQTQCIIIHKNVNISHGHNTWVSVYPLF